MDFLQLALEILVCLLAVYGLYALLCRLVSHACYKGDLSVALHMAGEWDMAEDEFRRAVWLTEAQNGKMRAPVVLLEHEKDQERVAHMGCDVYCKIKENKEIDNGR